MVWSKRFCHNIKLSIVNSLIRTLYLRYSVAVGTFDLFSLSKHYELFNVVYKTKTKGVSINFFEKQRRGSDSSAKTPSYVRAEIERLKLKSKKYNRSRRYCAGIMGRSAWESIDAFYRNRIALTTIYTELIRHTVFKKPAVSRQSKRVR